MARPAINKPTNNVTTFTTKNKKLRLHIWLLSTAASATRFGILTIVFMVSFVKKLVKEYFVFMPCCRLTKLNCWQVCIAPDRTGGWRMPDSDRLAFEIRNPLYTRHQCANLSP